jgi:hypothetical protein
VGAAGTSAKVALVSGKENNPPIHIPASMRCMFISLPDYEAGIPPALLPPHAQCWRALSLSLCAPWFVLSARFSEAADFVETFILSSDRDVAASIQTLEGELSSLLCMHPDLVDECVHWQGHAIREVWLASNPECPGLEVLLFVAHDGLEISGLFGELSKSLVRTTLLAKIDTPCGRPDAVVS